MCGFALAFPGPNRNINYTHKLDKALTRLERRGPDELGSTRFGEGYFGHRRLSIIDINTNQQPFVSKCKEYLIVFNGEIYNYKTLKKELTAHWDFKSDGDTEVILAGLVLFGTSFIPKLEGMWAFSFYDLKKNCMLLSRDPLGKKPLFYSGSSINDGFFASSEIPALKEIMPYSATIDHDHFTDYWKYGFFLENRTAYNEIHQVAPGSTLQVSSNEPALASQIISPSWTPNTTIVKPKDQNTKIEQIKSSLESAVEKRLVADVEVGCFLSGGLDSSIVSMLASKKQKIKTYSMAFTDASFDESVYAKRMADFLGTDHHTIEFQDPSSNQLEDVILSRIGQPFVDTSILALEQLCETVGKDIKVSLSGDGADEIFGGYQRYGAVQIAQLYDHLPKPITHAVSYVSQKLKEGHAHHSHSIRKQWSLFIELYSQYKHQYIAPRLFSDSQLSSMLQQPIVDNTPAILQHADPANHMMRMDLKHYVNEDILTKVDAASMHHGLEVRSPFLDPKVIETAISIPGKDHRKLNKGKKLLMLCYKDQLPDWIWSRKKHGFVTPVARWFRFELGDRLIERLAKTCNTLNPIFVHNLLKKHRSGEDHSSRLWAIYIYLVWLGKETE